MKLKLKKWAIKTAAIMTVAVVVVLVQYQAVKWFLGRAQDLALSRIETNAKKDATPRSPGSSVAK